MSHIRIHYMPDTGRIVAWDNASLGPGLHGSCITVIDIPDGHDIQIDPTAQRINVDTIELENLSEEETILAQGPQDWQLKQAIALELMATDGMMAPDRSVPDRDAWAAYRQALRDLSKGHPRPTAVQMLVAFPIRPDGANAVAALQQRPPRS